MANFELPQIKYPEQKGLISIIIPIYNNEIYLRECLDSILAQTSTNWEAILVDDGSTDNTGKIVDEYAKKDSRFIAIHKQNGGTLLARKTGLENSRGEFIANIDHDDAYHPQFLEKMHSKIMETNADFAYCNFLYMRKNSPYRIEGNCDWSQNASENIAMYFRYRNKIGFSLWNKLIRREIYAKVLFPNIKAVNEDQIQMSQIIYNTKSIVYVPETLYFYKEGGISSKQKSIVSVQQTMYIKETLEKIFNCDIPQNVKNAFHYFYNSRLYKYFLLDKKQRIALKNDVEPLLSEFIKLEEKFILKICLLLARKGIIFPFKLIEDISFLSSVVYSKFFK